MAEQSILRWGILGAARVNERLMPAIVEASNAKLIAVASRRQGAAAEVLEKHAPQETDVLALDNPDDLLKNPEIDAIYLPMANEEHTEWAIKAIKQGKHVLIEKPMALSLVDIEAIETAANQHKVMVMEGFMYVFHPQHDAVHQLIDSGVIGEVRTVRTCFSFPMKPARLYRITRDIEHGGGAMWDIGPYAIHTARKWFDREPVSVVSMAKLNEHGADVSLSGVLDYDDGKFAHFDMSFERARRSEYEIIGTLGGVKCETVWNNPDDDPVVSWWTDAGERHTMELEGVNHFVREIEHFSDCVLSGKIAKLSFEDAKGNCKAIEAALESVTTGRKIEIS
ncbi:MAG: Gfo/Idh/MocA family oxidoreductase [Gammaproteobacteria bacterium]|nr:Gfo/Idh/MocA family oxidoreductase [Gammaproteobacteria bacterium]